LLIWSFSTGIAGWSLKLISPQTLTVVAGLLSATSGVLWLAMIVTGRLTLPGRRESEENEAAMKSLSVASK
jgi:hypothetical protein